MGWRSEPPTTSALTWSLLPGAARVCRRRGREWNGIAQETRCSRWPYDWIIRQTRPQTSAHPISIFFLGAHTSHTFSFLGWVGEGGIPLQICSSPSADTEQGSRALLWKCSRIVLTASLWKCSRGLGFCRARWFTHLQIHRNRNTVHRAASSSGGSSNAAIPFLGRGWHRARTAPREPFWDAYRAASADSPLQKENHRKTETSSPFFDRKGEREAKSNRPCRSEIHRNRSADSQSCFLLWRKGAAQTDRNASPIKIEIRESHQGRRGTV